MMHSAECKIPRRVWLISVMICQLLAGCGRWPSSSANEEPVPKPDRYDLAIAKFNTQIESNPYNARAYYERGLVYYNKGEYDKALQDVKKAQDLGYQVPAEFLRLLSEASKQNR